MSKKVIVNLLDDIDGSVAEGTVEFALDGIGYAIDLSAGNQQKLRAALAPYVQNGQRRGRISTGMPVQRRGSSASIAPGSFRRTEIPMRRSNNSREQLKAMRDWAVKNGFPGLSAKGRIPGRVVEAYEAHQEALKNRAAAKAVNGSVPSKSVAKKAPAKKVAAAG